MTPAPTSRTATRDRSESRRDCSGTPLWLAAAWPNTGSSTDPTSGTTDEAGQTCGDGILDPGEGCDDGPGNAIYAACTDECQLNVCGDHKVHVGVETCDEGTINRCGDGELDEGHEQCDDGALNGSGGRGEFGQAGCDVDYGFFGRRIFLSSQVFTGDMGTRAGADLACEIMATQADFKNSYKFRALLANSKGSPNSFVQPDPDGLGRPFILPGGLILAASSPERPRIMTPSSRPSPL